MLNSRYSFHNSQWYPSQVVDFKRNINILSIYNVDIVRWRLLQFLSLSKDTEYTLVRFIYALVTGYQKLVEDYNVTMVSKSNEMIT